LCVARDDGSYEAGDGDVVVEQSPKPETSLDEGGVCVYEARGPDGPIETCSTPLTYP
jgi:hypothetical protein